MAAKKVIDLGSSEVDEKNSEVVEVFKLDGKTYTAPKTVSAGMSLQYLEKQAEEGPDAAIYFMFIKLLGQEAFDALKNHPTLTKDQLDDVMGVVEKLTLSDEEGK